MFYGTSIGVIVALLIFAICEYALHVSEVIAVLMVALVMEHESE